MDPKALLSQVAIVLIRPKIPENIGAAARIAWNMGITRLILVGDDVPEREPMAKMATHKAAHLVDNLKVFQNLDEALAEFSMIVGTTARRGRQRLVEKSPRELVDSLLPLLGSNKVAILFGPEDTGLTNEDLKYCHMASAIPTADFSSINLAQAVAIHCYELYYGVLHAQEKTPHIPQLATSHELESMYAYLEETLSSFQFLEETNRSYWMTNIRHLFNRVRLNSKDANIVRTVCKKLLLYQQTHKS